MRVTVRSPIEIWQVSRRRFAEPHAGVVGREDMKPIRQT